MPNAVEKSSVVEFYKNGRIFITGGTGFLGKCLTEKLLRTCPNIDQIYLLIRLKENKDPQTRLKELFADPIFSVIRKEQPDFEKKVTCIPGDICYPKLDLSDEHYELLSKEVTHVVHVAATVRFNEELGSAININVFGTLEVLTLCKKCSQLKIFVHVSTAYSHCPKKYIEEQYYNTPITGEDALALRKILDHDQLEQLCPQLIKPWPNTYSFTKAIVENTIKNIKTSFPIIIFRPSIVMGTLEEPVKGWTDNIYGPQGLLFGVGAGVLRVINGDLTSKPNLVPVDYTINALLCCASNVGTVKNNAPEKSSDGLNEPLATIEETPPKIFNFVASENNSITWREFLKIFLTHGLQNPSKKCLWYYTVVVTGYKPIYIILFLLLHCLPGLLLDGILLLLGKKPKLLKVYKRIYLAGEIFRPFGFSTWTFSNKNVNDIWSQLNDTDKILFNFDVDKINWHVYFLYVVLGLRKYMMKESDDSLPAARKRMSILYFAHRFVQLATLVFCYWCLKNVYFTFRQFSEAPFEESMLTTPQLLKNTT